MPSIKSAVSEDDSVLSSNDTATESTHQDSEDLRTFLNSLTTHLMPELPVPSDDETEDEHSYMSEPKSFEEPVSQENQVADSVVKKSLEDAKELFSLSQEYVPSNEIEFIKENK